MNLATIALIERLLAGLTIAPQILAQIGRLTGSIKDAIAGGTQVTPEQFAALEGETNTLMAQIVADTQA